MKGMKYARHILADNDRLQWVSARREWYRENQLAFVDSLTPVYKPVMIAMPAQPSKIFYAISSYYGHPVSVATLANETRLPRNAVAAQLSRLVKAGMLKRTEQGYFIDIVDFLRFYAVRYDLRFRNWREVNKAANLADIVDRFIGDMKQKRSQALTN